MGGFPMGLLSHACLPPNSLGQTHHPMRTAQIRSSRSAEGDENGPDWREGTLIGRMAPSPTAWTRCRSAEGLRGRPKAIGIRGDMIYVPAPAPGWHRTQSSNTDFLLVLLLRDTCDTAAHRTAQHAFPLPSKAWLTAKLVKRCKTARHYRRHRQPMARSLLMPWPSSRPTLSSLLSWRF